MVALGNDDEQVFRRIGVGLYERNWFFNDSQSHVMQREDDGPGRSLLDDYNVHQKVQRAVFESRPFDSEFSASLPRGCLFSCHGFMHHDDQVWWGKIDLQIPYGIPDILQYFSSLIAYHPFPKKSEIPFIDRYCHEPLKSSIKTSVPKTKTVSFVLFSTEDVVFSNNQEFKHPVSAIIRYTSIK